MLCGPSDRGVAGMSETQFVEFANRGFWAYDVALGVFLKHLVDAGEHPDYDEVRWVQDALPKWRTVIAVAGSGLGWQIDEGWSDGESKLFLQLVAQATEQLASREAITVDEMKQWSVFEGLDAVSRGAAVVKTAPIVELGQAIHRLLESSLPHPPEGKHWFYGTPSGRTFL